MSPPAHAHPPAVRTGTLADDLRTAARGEVGFDGARPLRVIANGFSCREQIRPNTTRRSLRLSSAVPLQLA